jgi:hypothetical protein
MPVHPEHRRAHGHRARRTVLLANMPALDDVSKLTCLWGGMISVAVPGSDDRDIP